MNLSLCFPSADVATPGPDFLSNPVLLLILLIPLLLAVVVGIILLIVFLVTLNKRKNAGLTAAVLLKKQPADSYAPLPGFGAPTAPEQYAAAPGSAPVEPDNYPVTSQSIPDTPENTVPTPDAFPAPEPDEVHDS